jgi:pyruvate/2-oxoglutarate dehydrogenase complex dihydrolipoamide acyltransferase (E2) component
LFGTNLFLATTVGASPELANATDVPPDFTGTQLSVPHPTSGILYLKLRDDPATVQTLTLPVVTATPPAAQPAPAQAQPAPSPAATPQAADASTVTPASTPEATPVAPPQSLPASNEPARTEPVKKQP